MKKIPVLFKVSARERKTTGMFILLVIFVVLIYIIFPDRLQNLDLVRTQLKHQNDLIESREIKKARLLELQREFNMLKEEGENVYGMFFNREDIVNFLKSMNDLAEIKTGNDLLIVHPLPEVEIETQQGNNESSPIFKRKIIKLAVEGSYKTIEDLLSLFDNYGKNLQIERISLENDPRVSIIRARIELVIYVIAEVDKGLNKSDNLQKIESVRERAEKRSISEGDYGLEEPFIPMSVTTAK